MAQDVPNQEPAGYNPNSTAAAPGAAYKRSGHTKADLLKRFRTRIEVSRKWRDDEQYCTTWDRLRDLYRNKHFSGGLSTEDRIAINVSFSTVNTIVPSVAVNYPQVTVNPRNELMLPNAECAEAMVNYWWRHYDWRKDIKRTVKDSLITGHGWVKVGWKHETKQRDLTDEEFQAQYQAEREKLGDTAEANPALAGGLPGDQDLLESLPTTTSEVVKDCPFVERVSPHDMLVDPEATCVDDLKWIAQRLVQPIEDVRKNPQYNQTVAKKLQANAGTNPRWRDGDGTRREENKYSDDMQRVTLWEFYDLQNKFYCVFAESGEGFLLEPTDFPYAYGMPFEYLGNYEVPDQFYDIGDLEAIEPMQHELNAVRSDMMNHRKRWQRAYLALKDKLTPEAWEVLEDDRDGRIVPIEGDEDLSRLVMPIQQVTLDANMYSYSEQIENDIDMVSGVSEYQRGAISEIRRTATEAAMIQDASNARSADKLAQIEAFMQSVARKVVQLAQQYLTGEHVARVVGPDGAASWIAFDNFAIQGEFDFEVEAGSTQPRDETYKRQEALQLASVLSPYVGVAVSPQALVTYVLKAFGIKNPEQFVMMPMPMSPEETGETEPDDEPDEGEYQPGQASSPPMPQEALSLPVDGAAAMPPNALAQLQGQVGLDLPHS